jgi:hypothetical protein
LMLLISILRRLKKKREEEIKVAEKEEKRK